MAQGDGTVNASSNARQVRPAAIVIIVAMLGWMGLSWLGGRLGWPARFAMLVDFSAIAAFLWSMFVLFQVWRKRQRDEG